MPTPPSLLTVELYFADQMKELIPLQENKEIFSKKYFSNILEIFRKITFLLFAYYFCVIGSSMIFCIVGERN